MYFNSLKGLSTARKGAVGKTLNPLKASGEECSRRGFAQVPGFGGLAPIQELRGSRDKGTKASKVWHVSGISHGKQDGNGIM